MKVNLKSYESAMVEAIRKIIVLKSDTWMVGIDCNTNGECSVSDIIQSSTCGDFGFVTTLEYSQVKGLESHLDADIRKYWLQIRESNISDLMSDPDFEVIVD